MPSLKGQLLIAAPGLVDPNFAQAVVFMVQHNREGAMGLIINRATETPLAEVWEQFSEEPTKLELLLHSGGPCEGPLMVLHTHRPLADLHVTGPLHFSSSEDHVRSLVSEGVTPAKYIVGYAGWGPGQLEYEMKENAWLVAPATVELVLQSTEGLWQTLLENFALPLRPAGLDAAIVPEDPSVN
ncbi:MAG: YqgE/AlgH family protein [Planctomycetes bacterium]|nr:YqgE/AlgH family protein [Planctomycetota bacterium]